MHELREQQFKQMYNLLDEFVKRSVWGYHGMMSTTGHLGLCSSQIGDPEKCHICGTTIKSINLLNEIDLAKILIEE